MTRTKCSVITLIICSEIFRRGHGFSLSPPSADRNVLPVLGQRDRAFSRTARFAARADADFDTARGLTDGVVDANRYNIPMEEAAEMWTVSVKAEASAARAGGTPYMDSKSKDHFVDDLDGLAVTRAGGLGMELTELAGGRDDGYGLTIVSDVYEGGNAAAAGILAGDSIAAVAVTTTTREGNTMEETMETRECECRDFDTTIDALGTFPGDADVVFLSVRRLRRWPKIQVRVEYPPSQCAEGVDNVKQIELFAGENLQRALLNRGIIMDDPEAPKCDYCGNKCVVSVRLGQKLCNPMGITESKLMKRNPRCRLACKTTVGFNMQEGDMALRVNLRQWKD
mmetsp:Transcript_25350/g.50504  ORF Transcript_25350/g.50504 Transcript_25350/m.50504 type:complete len:340 (-) Transcript_25350:207-1226(-)|eukprot:CAMPEP_0194329708 /NCGR_PEP_ID=MMETSP0171-20130528/49147_1 /TAXON_ID=218684 /ORGANISM="Corethron pennatum, Strain L29A3" /LENGTH=339 /DNA_ID=CAMNT_0039090515 /DNA_START=43 /DNA_END=1062 /DNA_ORIENTATION=+